MALTGQSALARASYVASARAKALTPPNHHFQHLEVAAFCAATWLVFPPPLTLEAVTRIDAIFYAERAINGLAPDARLFARRAEIAPLVAELEAGMRHEHAVLLRHAPAATAIDYMLRRWDDFAGFLADGRICLTNNAAERALRGVALGRKAESSPAPTSAAAGRPLCTR